MDQQEQLIDIAEEENRCFWASKLGVSIEKLKSAVRATHSLEYRLLKNYLRYGSKKRYYKTQDYVRN
jgi:hypothetical protein